MKLREASDGFRKLLEGSGTPGRCWRLLEASGGFWRLLVASGEVWRLLKLLEASEAFGGF